MDTLAHRNFEVVFGLPDDGINGLIEALRKRKDKIRFIQVRQERAAAFYGVRLCRAYILDHNVKVLV